MKMEEGLANPDVFEIGQEIAPGDTREHCTASNLQAQPCAEQYSLGLIYQSGFQTMSKESQAFQRYGKEPMQPECFHIDPFGQRLENHNSAFSQWIHSAYIPSAPRNN